MQGRGPVGCLFVSMERSRKVRTRNLLCMLCEWTFTLISHRKRTMHGRKPKGTCHHLQIASHLPCTTVSFVYTPKLFVMNMLFCIHNIDIYCTQFNLTCASKSSKLNTPSTFTSQLLLGISNSHFPRCKYLTLGAMCCGHIAALAAMLVLSLGQNKIGSSFGRQGAVLGAPGTWDQVTI